MARVRWNDGTVSELEWPAAEQARDFGMGAILPDLPEIVPQGGVDVVAPDLPTAPVADLPETGAPAQPAG